MSIRDDIWIVSDWLDWGPEFGGTPYRSIRRLIEFAEIMRSVHTPHDAQAEMDSWDEFFESMKAMVNGNR